MLYAGSVKAKLIEDLADALESSGVELEMYHAEATPGQVVRNSLEHDYLLTA